MLENLLFNLRLHGVRFLTGWGGGFFSRSPASLSVAVRLAEMGVVEG